MRTVRVGIGTIAAVAAVTVIIWLSVLASIRAAEITTEVRLLRESVASLSERLAGLAPDATSRQTDPQAPSVAKLENANGMSLGRKDAPLTIVEFTDLECPFCSQFTVTAFPELKRRFVDTGMVRFVTKDFPLSFHRTARDAAIACRCAGEQGKFWEFRHEIAKHARNLSKQAINGVATSLGLDLANLARCLSNPKYGIEVDRDYAEGARAGVSGTPTFIVGKSGPDGFVGKRFVGVQDVQALDAQIRALLDEDP
jgi:protein-disulfide isomerase